MWLKLLDAEFPLRLAHVADDETNLTSNKLDFNHHLATPS